MPRTMLLTLRSFPCLRGGALLLAAACFAAGLAAGALVAPADRRPPACGSARAGYGGDGVGLPIGHPAEVLRVIDGDTFVARVHIWPGMDVTTRVRLRGIDAPELHARCEEERSQALAARDGARADSGARRGRRFRMSARTNMAAASMPDARPRRRRRLGGDARAAATRAAYFGGRRESWCG